MPSRTEDRNLYDFFDSVLQDQLEKLILKLILDGNTPESITEELLKDPLIRGDSPNQK